ncbi:MAG: HEAT repeat domain-containing protein [Chthonomonadaceae bacterium]|nr:HEAT repeat domain-containing protein [Chthonomonadaceae bacterium]
MWQRWILVLACVFGGSMVQAQLTEQERDGIRDVLSIGNLIPADLRFERKVFSDPNRIAWIDECLDDPSRMADEWIDLHKASLDGGAAAVVSLATKRVLRLPPVAPGLTAPTASTPIAGVDPVTLARLRMIVAAMKECDKTIREATSKLSAEEKRELITGLPVWAVEEPKVTFDFVTAPTGPQARLLELMEKVDMALIVSAGENLARTVEIARNDLKRKPAALSGLIRINIDGLLVEIGGNDDNDHSSTDARLTLDIGGNDTYTGRAGSGVGYSSVLIDLGGNDHFAVRDLSVGAGVLGVGLAYVDGGDDTFRGKSLCYGSGVAGLGVFQKTGGDDDYRSVALAQGFGMFGVGLCLDSSGNDRYDVKLYGQGAARTRGVGWLVDRKGGDTYFAGGLSMNEPLFSGVSYSNSQAYSAGFREDTGGVSGGVGVLTDHEGDDQYWVDTYGEAASYWFSASSLGDMAGNDSYGAHHYAQASAMHCCSSYLFDLSGDDSYTTKVGASLAIGHDYGVAFLVDRAGDDLYCARDSTPGLGVANGLGIFLDAGGVDRYDGPPGQGQSARGSGSLGLFIDLGGADKYRVGLSNGEAHGSEHWGYSYDKELAVNSVEDAIAPSPQVGSRPMPADAEMERIFSEATLWGVGQAQVTVQSAVRRLIEIGQPAWDWMLTHKLGTMDRLQRRAFVAVAKAIGHGVAGAVGRVVLNGTTAEKKALLSICAESGSREIAPAILGWVDDPGLQKEAVVAAGTLKVTEAVPALQKVCLSSNRLLARSAAVSLMQIGDLSAVGTAQALLTSSDFQTRMAALQLLSKSASQAATIGGQLIEDSDEQIVRMGVKLLSVTGTLDALKTIGALLLDPRPGVRMEALLALDKKCPEELRATFESLKHDPVPLVRAVAKGTKVLP